MFSRVIFLEKKTTSYEDNMSVSTEEEDIYIALKDRSHLLAEDNANALTEPEVAWLAKLTKKYRVFEEEGLQRLMSCLYPSEDETKKITISNRTRSPLLLHSHYLPSGTMKFGNILLSGSKCNGDNHVSAGLHIPAGETVVAWAPHGFSGVVCFRNVALSFYLGASKAKADVWIRTHADDDLSCTKANDKVTGRNHHAGSCTSCVDDRGRCYSWDLSEKENEWDLCDVGSTFGIPLEEWEVEGQWRIWRVWVDRANTCE